MTTFVPDPDMRPQIPWDLLADAGGALFTNPQTHEAALFVPAVAVPASSIGGGATGSPEGVGAGAAGAAPLSRPG